MALVVKLEIWQRAAVGIDKFIKSCAECKQDVRRILFCFCTNTKVTMSSLAVFNFESSEVRTIVIDGDVWFVAKDICDAMDIVNVSQAVSSLDDDERLIYTLDISGQNRDTLLISESGMYSVVLVSRKPQAKEFKKWITSAVIPSIRKTGKYEIEQPKPITQAEALLQSVQLIIALEQKVDKLESTVNAIELDRRQLKQQLHALPEPLTDVPESTTRAKLNEVVRLYSVLNGDFRGNWKKLYREFRDRYHIDLVVRAKNAGVSTLDYVAANGLIEDLYSLAHLLFANTGVK